jgi:hypothetical protein
MGRPESLPIIGAPKLIYLLGFRLNSAANRLARFLPLAVAGCFTGGFAFGAFVFATVDLHAL